MPSKRCHASRKRPNGLWIGSTMMRRPLPSGLSLSPPLRESFSAVVSQRFSGWRSEVWCRGFASATSWLAETKACTVISLAWCLNTWYWFLIGRCRSFFIDRFLSILTWLHYYHRYAHRIIDLLTIADEQTVWGNRDESHPRGRCHRKRVPHWCPPGDAHRHERWVDVWIYRVRCRSIVGGAWLCKGELRLANDRRLLIDGLRSSGRRRIHSISWRISVSLERRTSSRRESAIMRWPMLRQCINLAKSALISKWNNEEYECIYYRCLLNIMILILICFCSIDVWLGYSFLITTISLKSH